MSDEVQDLEMLNVFLGVHVFQTIEASVVMGAARLPFAEHPEWFFTNPANTLVYRALHALEERTVVQIAEILRDEKRIFTNVGEIRRKAELLLHRTILSHPSSVKWHTPEKQQFFDERRQWTDLRAALVWDMNASVNERLRALGREPQIRHHEVHVGMAIALHSILRLSIRGEMHGLIPDEKTLFETLQTFQGRFIEFLEKRPDGRATPPRG